MIEFISHHPVVVPLSKIPNPTFPLSLLPKAFESFKFKYGVLEVRITDDKIIPVDNAMFLREIGLTDTTMVFRCRNQPEKSFNRS